jgi:hypothetical protein
MLRIMDTRIVVEELPASATEAEVVELLSSVGSVISISRRQESPETASQGFLVEMETEEQAATAIAAFDLEGIRVRQAS